MYGLQRFRDKIVQWRVVLSPDSQSAWGGFYQILTGNPPVYQNIDGMQLVMKRTLWLQEGGWYDKRYEGDGMMYEAFTKKYGYRHVGPVLGAHH